VKNLIDKAYDHCRKLLSDNAHKMQGLSDYLLEHESMSGAQFAAFMAGEEVGEASATDLFDEFREAE
jgi:ATP-dependent Zn protease